MSDTDTDSVEMANLKTSISSEIKYIKNLIDTIPSQFYSRNEFMEETPNQMIDPKNEKKNKNKLQIEGQHMIFSKFDFAETGSKGKKRKTPNSKDYKQLIEKVEKKKLKIKELEEKDVEKANLMKEKDKWMKAINKAEGIKVKDNPDQLKKALKNKELRAKKSKKKWESREKQIKEKMEKRQKKRKENIKSRRDAKIKKKIKKATKKGRYIPL